MCFDLDGTLVDSGETIIKSTIASLVELEILYEFDRIKFKNMIGLHFNDIFKILGIDVPDFEKFIEVYKKRYFDFISDSELYAGVIDTLEYLKRKNIKVSLLTTKSQEQADRIIDHFNLRKYFSYVMGRRNGFAHKPSPEPLFSICREINTDTKNTLMIGDTELDIICGKNAGALTCAVLYGYRNEEQLKSYQPDYLLKNLNDLNKIIV